MSLIIKGMKMPTDCCQCKLARYDDYENETFCPFTDVMCLSIGRQDNCPLEELNSAQPEPCEDAVSREDVQSIAERSDWFESSDSFNDFLCALYALPSAEPENIRCKDCKHWKRQVGPASDGLGDCTYHRWKLVTSNGYCFWAERRTDD